MDPLSLWLGAIEFWWNFWARAWAIMPPARRKFRVIKGDRE